MNDYNLSWQEGIIYKLETFLKQRYPAGPWWARSIASCLVSIYLHDTVLDDKMGPVKPNIFTTYIGPSGIGCKTPPLMLVRRFLKNYFPGCLAPSKFTPEGFTEWVMGTKKAEREKVDPHPNAIIIRDEITKLQAERESQTAFKNLWEYLSELWDGWIEGYYTRRFQYEGAMTAYTVLLTAGTEYFLENLTEGFFIQGLGNRLLFVVENPPKPERRDHREFFFNLGDKDEEMETLFTELAGMLQKLPTLPMAFLSPDAGQLWADYEFKMRHKIWEAMQQTFEVGNEERDVRYEVKQPLNALKLAMIYAGARLNIKNDVCLWVSEEDMRRALEDVEAYLGMWKKAMDWWKREQRRGRPERRVQSSRYDLLEIVGCAKRCGGLVSAKLIQDQLNLAKRTEVLEVLGLGVSKGWFAISANAGERGDLTEDEYARFKPKAGPSPQVFRLTDEGWKAEL